MKAASIVVAVLMLALVAGCGGDESDEPQAPATEESASAEAEAEPAAPESEPSTAEPQGVSADADAKEIVDCINAAGVEASLEDTSLVGTKTDVEHFYVQLDGADFGGHVFVFGSEADRATDEKAVAEYGAEGEAIGRIYFAYQAPTNPESEGADVAKACLPEA